MQVVYKDTFTVVGILVEGTWDELPLKMRAGWQDFYEKASAIPYSMGDAALDISLNEDEGMYTQLICMEVSRVDEAPPGWFARDTRSRVHLLPPSGRCYADR